jgi:hypothetical protein
VTIVDNDTQTNTAPSAINVAADTYDTDGGVDVEGFGYDQETGNAVTYEILSQPAEGTITLLEDGKTFHFEPNAASLEALSRGEIKPVSFDYRVSNGELWSAPAKITINVHGTNPGDETIQAFSRTTTSQVDFFPLDGKDGNDTVVFNSVTLTSGTGIEISLGKAIHLTEYDMKPLVNIENITIKNTTGNVLRTMKVGGDDQNNVITIENTNHKLTLVGLNGDDTFNFNGTGEGLKSVITGGAGNDTVNANSGVFIDDRGSAGGLSGDDAYNFGTGVQHGQFYAGNGKDTVTNFEKGIDKLHFLGGLSNASVVATEEGGNTVFTINGTNTVTVANVTGLTAGTDWLLT